MPKGEVLGYDPKAKQFYDFEVKFISVFSLTNDGESTGYLADQFEKYREQREDAISAFIGKNITTKVIVTTKKMLGKSEAKRSEMEGVFHQRMEKLGDMAQVWYFDDMIPELVRHADVKGRYNTQLLQTIRMLKLYEE